MKHFFVVFAGSLALLFSLGPLLFKAWTQTLPPLPAPTIDRVGFPTNHQNTFVKVYTFDNFQNRQIRVVWANPIAASVTPKTVHKFPFGSMVVMETYAVMEDANGNFVLDANGRFIPSGAPPTIFVQRKEMGFGFDYGVIWNGDWEYVAYHPDGSYATPPSAPVAAQPATFKVPAALPSRLAACRLPQTPSISVSNGITSSGRSCLPRPSSAAVAVRSQTPCFNTMSLCLALFMRSRAKS